LCVVIENSFEIVFFFIILLGFDIYIFQKYQHPMECKTLYPFAFSIVVECAIVAWIVCHIYISFSFLRSFHLLDSLQLLAIYWN